MDSSYKLITLVVTAVEETKVKDVHHIKTVPGLILLFEDAAEEEIRIAETTGVTV